VTGHCANSDDREVKIETPAQVAQVPHSETHRRGEWIRIVKAALVYFLIVFGAGSLLGPIRILFVVPRFGERMAELLEMPLMLLVIILSAKWIVRRFQLPIGSIYRLGAGVIAFLLVLFFEFGLVLIIRGLTLREYFESRDQITASAYYLTLLLFVAMPLLASRHMHIK
jgi:hypothetical protein